MRAWAPALRDAVRFWEPRRLAYNAILAVVLALLVALNAPARQTGHGESVLAALGVLVLGVNLAYSAAYLVDPALRSLVGARFLRRWRWAVWSAGTAASVLLLSYWTLDEVLSPP